MKPILMVLLFFPLSIMAGPIGDSAILSELKALYATTLKDLQELKAQSETLNQTRDLAQKAYATYDDVRKFDLERISEIIESDVKNLTELDDMKGLTAEQKYLLLTRELDRRIADPKTSEQEKQAARNDKARLESILKQEDLINELHKNSTANLKRSASDLSERDSSRILAENSSILTRIETAREKRRLEDERARIQDRNSARKMMQQQAKSVKNNGW